MRYFDYASTSPLDERIRREYEGLLERYFANSEARHPLGRQVNRLLEESRRKTAALLHVLPQEIVFTSGASEANSLAVKGYAFAQSRKGKHLITTKVEHSSVRNSFRQLEELFGYEVTWLDVDAEGKIDPAELERAIRKDTILVSIMMVNNETGTVEPIEQIKQVMRNHPGVRLHMDAVQAVGKMPVDLEGIDLASFAAHKIGGLDGCGVLYKKKGVPLAPLISGGSQEYGLRGGTENALNYAVFGHTLELALAAQEEHREKAEEMSRYLRERLASLDGVVINSPPDASPFILSFSCLNLPSEVHQNALAEEGFSVSSQSTCHSAAGARSYVLEAMGIRGKRQSGVIRVSFGEGNTMEDCRDFYEAVKENLEKYATH